MHESTSDSHEDFFDALALLHSTKQDSTEKLRQMLDTCVEKTLAVRTPKRFLQNVDKSAFPMHISKKYIPQEHSAIKTEIWNGDPEIISLLEADEAENIRNFRTYDVKVFKVDYENCCEDEEDIPRISIPDEDPGTISADGTVCKVFFN